MVLDEVELLAVSSLLADANANAAAGGRPIGQLELLLLLLRLAPAWRLFVVLVGEVGVLEGASVFVAANWPAHSQLLLRRRVKDAQHAGALARSSAQVCFPSAVVAAVLVLVKLCSLLLLLLLVERRTVVGLLIAARARRGAAQAAGGPELGVAAVLLASRNQICDELALEFELGRRGDSLFGVISVGSYLVRPSRWLVRAEKEMER